MVRIRSTPAASAAASNCLTRSSTSVTSSLAVTSAEACERFELPADRIGDVVVVSTRQKVIGTSPDRHDLSGLTEPLRSHGGITEQRVPMIANRPITVPMGRTLRNFDVFDVALNLVN